MPFYHTSSPPGPYPPSMPIGFRGPHNADRRDAELLVEWLRGLAPVSARTMLPSYALLQGVGVVKQCHTGGGGAGGVVDAVGGGPEVDSSRLG